MKRITLLLSLVILFTALSKKAEAQYYFYNDSYYDNPMLFEVGGSVGIMNCLTDLGGKKGIGKKYFKDLNFGNNHVAGGVYFNMMYKYKFAVRLEATFGKISAFDSILKGVPPNDIALARYNRNLNFRTSISEFSLVTEIHPLFIFIDWLERDADPPRYSPYLLAGVGYYSFNPQTFYNNRWIDLAPLSTEGEGFKEYPDRQPYKLKQINFQVGGGIKYELSTLLNVRGEFIYRILNTDYIDDVSTTYVDPTTFANNITSPATADLAATLANREIVSITKAGGKRGSPAQKDGYFSFNLKLGLTLGRERIR